MKSYCNSRFADNARRSKDKVQECGMCKRMQRAITKDKKEQIAWRRFWMAQRLNQSEQ